MTHLRIYGLDALLSLLGACGFLLGQLLSSVPQVPAPRVESGLIGSCWCACFASVGPVLFDCNYAEMFRVNAGAIFANVVSFESSVPQLNSYALEDLQGDSVYVSAPEPLVAPGIAVSINAALPHPAAVLIHQNLGFYKLPGILDDSRPARTEPVAEHHAVSPSPVGRDGLTAVLAGSILLDLSSHKKGV